MKLNPLRITIILIVLLFTSCGAPPLSESNKGENTKIATVTENGESLQDNQSAAIVGGGSQSPLVEPTATADVVEGSARSPLASPTATTVIEPTEVVKESPTPFPTSTLIVKPTDVIPGSPTPFQPTPTPVVAPTATETPVPIDIGIGIEEIRPLTFDDTTPAGQELRALLNTQPDWSYADYGADGPFNLLGWTLKNEVVVQPIIPNTKLSENPVWTINPVDSQTRPLPDWNLEPMLTEAQQQIVDNFAVERQPSPKFVRSYPSPGNEYLALLAIQENTAQNQLHIYHVGTAKEIVALPQAVADKQSAVTDFAPVWSPDGRKLAYGVAIYRTDEFPTETFELHIIEPSTGQLTKIKPVYYKGYPNSITWSPDRQYVAFSAQRSDHGPLSLFVVKASGVGLTDLTPDSEYWTLDDVFWSPDGNYVAYGSSGRVIWLARLNIK